MHHKRRKRSQLGFEEERRGRTAYLVEREEEREVLGLELGKPARQRVLLVSGSSHVEDGGFFLEGVLLLASHGFSSLLVAEFVELDRSKAGRAGRRSISVPTDE